YGCLKDLTLAHLIGNYLGLLHTAQFSGELVNGSNRATAGDRICDTDADPYHYYAPHDTLCNYTGIAVDANEDHYAPPVSNIMSEFRGCRCRFTFQQYYRMVQVFHQCREFLW
ncbi:MAG: DUF4384 domain-containing protein, partial [Bacteroidetes bacterium]|nr:DUF4384 domain-containing protein [Bacteroidota bacterium]